MMINGDCNDDVKRDVDNRNDYVGIQNGASLYRRLNLKVCDRMLM